jgi:hypothetical protein
MGEARQLRLVVMAILAVAADLVSRSGRKIGKQTRRPFALRGQGLQRWSCMAFPEWKSTGKKGAQALRRFREMRHD